MLFRCVQYPHPVTHEWHERSPGWVNDFIDKTGALETTHAIVAYDKGKIIGVFRFFYKRKRLYAQGTVLARGYKNKGIGKQLWKRAIDKFKPESIEVTTTSRGGTRFVDSLMAEYSMLEWDTLITL